MLNRTISSLLLLSLPTIASAQSAPTVEPTKANYLRIAAEVESSLQNDDLKKFFPASLDTTPAGGGFYENFSENWTHVAPGGGGRGRRGALTPAPAADTPIADPARSIVYQSRLTWLAAQAAERYPNQSAQYLEYTRHGAKFLMEKQWDKKSGGFWWTANSDGTARGDSKHVYGESFAIYALAASYKATHDQAALDAAKAGFMWLEKFSHDDKSGGYFEQLNGDGSHQTTGTDVVGAKAGQKSMNTHIHLLESFTELLQVWPDPLVKQRTEELYQININKIYADPGYLHLFFSADWTPIDSPDSYGHDIESAFLFADAAAALGKPDDPACWKAGKAIVDHCLAVAFDQTNGFLNGEGTLDGKGPMKTNLEWWVEAESLNALLLMHERYGKDDPKYWNAFVKQWAFIQNHFIDKTNGGWYKGVSTSLAATRGNKTDMWTEGYHQGRSMINVTNRLKNLANGR